MIVDGNISDLFFNTDLSGAVIEDHNGVFMGYRQEVLEEEAHLFLEILERLGVETPPQADLIADFYARM